LSHKIQLESKIRTNSSVLYDQIGVFSKGVGGGRNCGKKAIYCHIFKRCYYT
jgi:hypothetical protein